MSRGPSVEGVKKVRAAIKDYKYLCGRVVELRKAVAELSKIESDAESKGREIIKCLEEMDVKADGNCGWEGRIIYFLSELDKQAENLDA